MSPESAWPAEPTSSRTEWVEDEVVGSDDRKQCHQNVEAEDGRGVRSVNSASRVVPDYAEQPQGRHNHKDESASQG